MEAIEYTELYELLCRATDVGAPADRTADWYILMAARKVAHARFMELAYPETPAGATA